MNRPARFTKADVRRAMELAEQAGPDWAIEIEPDGKIRIVRLPPAPVTAPTKVEPAREIVL